MSGDGGTTDSSITPGGDSCTVLESGTWTVTGAAWGMGDNPMDGDVTMNEDDCNFTFSNWDMVMDDLPSGGALDGASVVLDGLNSYWSSCTGEASDEKNVAGTCEDDGAEFVMTFKE